MQVLLSAEIIPAELVEVEVNPSNQLRIKQGWHGRKTPNCLYENALRA